MSRQCQIRYLIFGLDRVSHEVERLTAAFRLADRIKIILSALALSSHRRRGQRAVRHDFRLDDILTSPPAAGNPLQIPELVARRLYIVRKGRFRTELTL